MYINKVLTPAVAKPSMSYSFRCATTEAEKHEIYHSRQEICQKDFGYILDHNSPFPALDQFDDHSHLFYVRSGEKVIASCRITPFVNGEWEISACLPDHIRVDLDPESTVQLNRVYIHEDHRNQYLHEFMFYYFSEWVLQYTAYRNYFAICNAGLVRLYSRIGASLGYKDGFPLKKRGTHLYYYVKGDIATFNKIVQSNYL